MKIAMFTNTYLPHMGGVAQSVSRFTEGLRALGHHVLVVAPEYANQPVGEYDVYRLPAIQNFNGSDFSLVLPIAPGLRERLDTFKPDLLHAHHPFLLGDMALRIAANRDLPLVFTHHTMYEHYTHYVPVDLPMMRTFVLRLSTGYANLCDRVVAPSASVADILKKRGVKTPIRIIPTGIDSKAFQGGDGVALRRETGIPEDAYVIGHAGRLAPEKNLRFLARAVAEAMERDSRAWFVVVGGGPSMARIRRTFKRKQLARRLLFLGNRSGRELVDAYHAMEVFAFSSKSETQGMVLAEAMASGLPVVALDAPGAREVVKDRENGRLLAEDASSGEFAEALLWVGNQRRANASGIRQRARMSAAPFDNALCVRKLADLYSNVLEEDRAGIDIDAYGRSWVLRSLEKEWELWSTRLDALGEAIAGDGEETSS